MPTSLSLRILIVDDNKTLAWVLRQSLVDRGYLCGVVDSASSALEAIESNTFDAVVADFHLRPGSGLELLREVQRQSPRTIRILMTGSIRPGEVIDQSVLHGHLPKPVAAHEVQQLLERHRRAIG